jgi:mediator of RNA polymerase II transcription subunit 13
MTMQGSKRSRAGMAESFGQVGTATNSLVQDAYKSDFSSMEVDNSTITGAAKEQIGSHWDWDDDDRGNVMDIQALLSEFGDFGDFFENDALPFGEVFSYPFQLLQFLFQSLFDPC